MNRYRLLQPISAALAWSLAATPVHASTTGIGEFGFLNQALSMAEQVLPALSLLAIVGGIMMWGIGGGGEGAMRKIGPIVMACGLATFVLNQGSFLGIGAATF